LLFGTDYAHILLEMNSEAIINNTGKALRDKNIVPGENSRWDTAFDIKIRGINYAESLPVFKLDRRGRPQIILAARVAREITNYEI